MNWSDLKKPKKVSPERQKFLEQLRRDMEQFYREAAEFLDRKVGQRKPQPTLFEDQK